MENNAQKLPKGEETDQISHPAFPLFHSEWKEK